MNPPWSRSAAPSSRKASATTLHQGTAAKPAGFFASKPGDEIDTAEKNVTEVHLNIDPAKHPIREDAFGKTHFVVKGTIYHAHTAHHLRPIVMLVSTLTAAAPSSGHH